MVLTSISTWYQESAKWKPFHHDAGDERDVNIKNFIKKLDINSNPKKVAITYPKKEILIMELNTEKHIDTITLSDSDDYETKDLSNGSPQKKSKSKNRKAIKHKSLNSSKKALCDLSEDEGREQEKENIANELNGDTDDDSEYVDEKEKVFRDKIRALPLF